jgi:copper chaperone NosL
VTTRVSTSSRVVGVASGRASAAWRILELLAGAWLIACRPMGGPQPIVWDREPCTHCRMLISEPRFAAQLEAEDGSSASFDDPGCLLAHVAALEPADRTLWFHHLREDRWISGDRVAFEAVAHTPMGYGLGAVDAGTPAALSIEAAKARVAQRAGGPEGKR